MPSLCGCPLTELAALIVPRVRGGPRRNEPCRGWLRAALFRWIMSALGGIASPTRSPTRPRKGTIQARARCFGQPVGGAGRFRLTLTRDDGNMSTPVAAWDRPVAQQLASQTQIGSSKPSPRSHRRQCDQRSDRHAINGSRGPPPLQRHWGCNAGTGPMSSTEALPWRSWRAGGLNGCQDE